MSKIRKVFIFFARQVYRILVIWPYEFVVFLISNLAVLFQSLCGTTKKSGNTVYFIVCSVIYYSNRRLTYADTRSVYSPVERIQQTLETISSIRKMVPQAKIILVEAGQQENIQELQSLVDHYVYVGGNKFVRMAVDSKLKSLGEAAILIAIKKYLPKDAEMYFKMSGRYVLSTTFNFTEWKTDKFKFFFVRKDYVLTRLYCFGSGMKEQWYWALVKSIPYLFLDYPIEFLLYKWVPKSLQQKNQIAGLVGYDATTGFQVVD